MVKLGGLDNLIFMTFRILKIFMTAGFFGPREKSIKGGGYSGGKELDNHTVCRCILYMVVVTWWLMVHTDPHSSHRNTSTSPPPIHISAAAITKITIIAVPYN